VVSVRDLDEEVRTTARLTLLVGSWIRLHEDAGRVGRDAVGGRECLSSHRLDDRRADGRARFLEPPAHGGAIDRHAEAREPILLTVERKPIAELVARDVSNKGRRRKRSLDQTRWHRGRDDRRAGRARIRDDERRELLG
jgi:antitoxin (DNA-binding transcriptional repressor) of toxin-antitoxin stability system